MQNPVPSTCDILTCPICNYDQSEKLFSSKDKLHKTPGIYVYKICNSCNTIYQDPMVKAEDLYKCYPSEYYTHIGSADNNLLSVQKLLAHNNVKKSIIDKARALIRHSIIDALDNRTVNGALGKLGRFLSKYPQFRVRAYFGIVDDDLLPIGNRPRKALDIGCGSGRQMLNLKRVGWEVEGVEWDSIAADMARKIADAKVYEGDFLNIDFEDHSYGLVLCSHVIEHMYKPVDVLKKIFEILAPGGILVLTYPNPESFVAKLFGSNWFAWEVPRHIIIPPAKTIIKISRDIGYAKVKTYTSSKYGLAWIAHSSDYKAGRSIIEFKPNVKFLDRLIYFVEKMLICLGVNIGQELTIVLCKKI